MTPGPTFNFEDVSLPMRPHVDEVLHHLVITATTAALDSRLAGRLDRAQAYRAVGEMLAVMRSQANEAWELEGQHAGVE